MASKSSNAIGKSSFAQTLHFITDIKLQELEKQRLAYQAHARVIDEAHALAEKGDVLQQVEVLAKAVKSWTGSGSLQSSNIVGGKLHLYNLEFWLQQAKKDPSFNLDIARGWADTLEEHIRHNVMRFDAAKLFGNLFNEWIASGDSMALEYQAGSDTDSDAMSFEHVELGKEIRDQKEKLESIIFEDDQVDAEKLKEYLDGLFESEEAAKELESLRRNMMDFGRRLQRKLILTDDVKNTIQGILASGLMDEEKRHTLKAFDENPTVMRELVSVMNKRMNNLSSWAWPTEGTLVEFRRHLNGKYRAFTDPEIVDALLLHHIGVAWQVQLKIYLRRLFDSKAWVRPPAPSPQVKDRRIAQLRGENESFSINADRNATRRANFFLSQLHEMASKPTRYDDLVDAPETTDKDATSPAEIKRKLLHIMTTECYLNKALRGSHATICSDLEWFGPSLPHTSILTVLEFLGMPNTWLDFFKAFLSTPLCFAGDAEPRTRKRGTPISYALSVVCGEAILFIMDFAVNQRANGLYLYRMHDDLWLWDFNAKKLADGWTEMNKYAEVAGLRFNVKKTGSAYIGPRTEDHTRLPEGDIRWGFLMFDPESSRFVIDQKDVDHHIIAMRRQLATTKSVFGWINAYNKYMTFFLRNFGGTPANCFDDAHVTDMINTIARIQRELLPSTVDDGVGAIGYLRRTLGERFGVKDLPEGYFYFPIARGGLELRNTILELLALERLGKPLASYADFNATEEGGHLGGEPSDIEDEFDDDWAAEPNSGGWNVSSETDAYNSNATAEAKFAKRIDDDWRIYNGLKALWDSGLDTRRTTPGYVTDLDSFLSFEEYISLRESWNSRWGQLYKSMLESPKQRHVTLVSKVREAVGSGVGMRGWESMDWYNKWVVSMYGEGVVKKFGELEPVDSNLIPIGMVELFRTSRMKIDL
ncbi:hypothetical protein GALMADRAFT_245079 [Galerina marginata CBS 339.88]|uniref:Reverse transcriptase domain-containing protein n=1 Tax=Galerina marginata (strain CBS 339.88) TaxID=685588 RepID=A0A067T4N1_GALM3|nr:hypothetical protein GALMADRAFT_245079 [Galerina marginata CBS 339.88]